VRNEKNKKKKKTKKNNQNKKYKHKQSEVKPLHAAAYVDFRLCIHVRPTAIRQQIARDLIAHEHLHQVLRQSKASRNAKRQKKAESKINNKFSKHTESLSAECLGLIGEVFPFVA
jgi:hypothetical protein